MPSSFVTVVILAVFAVVSKADQSCTAGTPCDLICTANTTSADASFCEQECGANCDLMNCTSSGKECTQICNKECSLSCHGETCLQECNANCSSTTCDVANRCTSNCNGCETMKCSGKTCSMVATSSNVTVNCDATEACELSCTGNCHFHIGHAAANVMVNNCMNGGCKVYCPKEATSCSCGSNNPNCEVIKVGDEGNSAMQLKTTTVSLVTVLSLLICYVIA